MLVEKLNRHTLLMDEEDVYFTLCRKETLLELKRGLDCPPFKRANLLVLAEAHRILVEDLPNTSR